MLAVDKGLPTVLLIRHAQASFGTPEYDVLSERGHRQAEALADALASRGIQANRVVVGSLRRHRDTASHWLAATAGGIETDPRWNEYDDGDVLSHHSTTPARLERRPGDPSPALSSREFQALLDAALSAWIAAGPSSPSRQTWPEFLHRVTGAFTDLVSDLRSGETAVAVTSSGAIAAVSGWLLGLAEEAFIALNRVTVNTGISKVVIGRQGTTLVSFNEHSHLEGSNRGLLTYR
jgi:broad specificity phosphatase PhoE